MNQIRISKIVILGFLILVPLISLSLYVISKSQYEAHMVLMPEGSDKQGALGKLGSLAGLNLNMGGSGGGGIDPRLFPEIVQSTPYLYKISHQKIYVKEFDSTLIVGDYLNYYGRNTGIGLLVDNLLNSKDTRLRNRLVKEGKSFSEIKIDSDTITMDEYEYRVSDFERLAIDRLRKRIELVQENTGMIHLTVIMPHPSASMEISKLATQFLREYSTAYNINRAKRRLEFIEIQHKEAKKTFYDAQNNLARFKDQNRGDLTASARTVEERLQNEFNIAYNLYNSLSAQLAQARINLNEETPVFSIFEPAQLPRKKVGPKLINYLIIGVVLGIFTSILWVLIPSLLFTLKQNYFSEVFNH